MKKENKVTILFPQYCNLICLILNSIKNKFIIGQLLLCPCRLALKQKQIKYE